MESIQYWKKKYEISVHRTNGSFYVNKFICVPFLKMNILVYTQNRMHNGAIPNYFLWNATHKFSFGFSSLFRSVLLDEGGFNAQNRNHGNNSNYQQNNRYQNNFNNYSSHGNQPNQPYHRQNQQSNFQQQNRQNRFQPYQQRPNNQQFGPNGGNGGGSGSGSGSGGSGSGGFNRNQQSNRGGYWR